MERNLTTMHIVYFLVTFLPVIVSSWASPFLRGRFLVRVRVFVRVCVDAFLYECVFSCVFACFRACLRVFVRVCVDACVFSFLRVFVFSFINSQPSTSFCCISFYSCLCHFCDDKSITFLWNYFFHGCFFPFVSFNYR